MGVTEVTSGPRVSPAHRPRHHPRFGHGMCFGHGMRFGHGMLAVTVVASVAVMGGCSSGFEPQTRMVEPEYTATDFGDLRIRALVLVKAADDRAVALVGTFVNEGTTADVLNRVTVEPERAETPRETAQPSPVGPVELLTAEPRLRIPAHGFVSVGGPGNPRIHLPDPRKRLRRGIFAKVTLSFARAGVAEVNVLVENPGGYLAPYAPSSATERVPVLQGRE